ncbi:MAG: hypothetical protein ACXV2C_00170 [Candidatus Bathyarchaeia archaeon]
MKYKVTLEIQFESETDLPELNMSGSGKAAEDVIAMLPEPPTDVDDANTYVKLEIVKLYNP